MYKLNINESTKPKVFKLTLNVIWKVLSSYPTKPVLRCRRGPECLQPHAWQTSILSPLLPATGWVTPPLINLAPNHTALACWEFVLRILSTSVLSS